MLRQIRFASHRDRIIGRCGIVLHGDPLDMFTDHMTLMKICGLAEKELPIVVLHSAGQLAEVIRKLI